MSFSFGAPSSAPASSGLGGGFSFGANKPATPGFGLTATTQSSGFFGTPATTAAPAFGATSGFGASTTPAFGANTSSTFGAATPAFGATSGFGTSATPAFGPTSTASAFGATATPAFGATSTAPAFGAAAATPAFGATSTAPAFGSTPTPAFGAAATPAFGSTTTPAFGATTQSAFGATATPAFGQTSAPSFGSGLGTGGLNFGTSTAASTGLTFGTPATTASTGLGGLGGFGFGAASTQNSFGFGATGTATTSNTLFETCLYNLKISTGSPVKSTMFPNSFPPDGFIPITQTFQAMPSYILKSPTCDESNPVLDSADDFYEIKCAKRDLYRTITPTPGAKLGATGTQLSTTVTSSLGLGGLGQSGIGTANTTTGDGKSEPPKQNKLPNEILTNVESFKEFIKKQKSTSSDIMRVSVKPLHKVSQEAESTLRQALSLSSEVSRSRAASSRLRVSAAAALAHAENCARDALGTELEDMAPPAYIKELLTELEQQITTFRRQMEVADKQMQAAPKLLTEQELTLGIRRMHESLVALAGRLQAVHTQVEAQKEQYLNLRKYVLKDSTDVFNSISASASLDQILRDAEGTRKKTKTGVNDSTLGRAVLSDPRAALGSISQLAGPTPFSYLANSLSQFPGADNTGNSWQPQPAPAPTTSFTASAYTAPSEPSSSFQLQKPPGKRGKQ